MTTPADQRPALADRIETALRNAAYDCDGTCGLGEHACDAQHPIQVAVLHHDQVATVYGDIPDLAAVAAGVMQPELDARDAEIARLTAERDQARADLNATARNRDQYRAAVAAVSLVPVRRREDGREYIAAADIRAALATTTVASGCGCQTDAHPGHYPTCPTTATTGA